MQHFTANNTCDEYTAEELEAMNDRLDSWAEKHGVEFVPTAEGCRLADEHEDWQIDYDAERERAMMAGA